MKKLLLFLTVLVATVTLSACKPTTTTGVESVTLAGFADATITQGDVYNVLDGVTATGSDGVDYSDLITVDSDDCTITEGVLDTTLPGICTIIYSVVVDGKLDRQQAVVTVEAEQVVVDGPTLRHWTWDTEADLDGWAKYESGGGSVAASIENETLKLDVVSGGMVYESRWSFMGLPLEKDQAYEVSFKAKSSVAGKKINLQFGELLASDPWFTDFKPGQTEHITLTEEWVEYSYSFMMTIDNQNGGPLFEMGNMEGSEGIDCTIWIEDLVIKGGSGTDTAAPSITGAADVIVDLNGTFDAAAGVMAEDFVDGDLTSAIVISGDTVDTATAGTYNVTYTVSDAAGNEATVTREVMVVEFVNDVRNDAISTILDADSTITADESASWFTTITWGNPIFTAEVVSNELIMTGEAQDGENYGTDFWNHIVRFTELRLVKDAVYRVTVNVKTDEVGNTTDNMMLKVETGAGAVKEMAYTVTDTYGEIELTFKYTGDTTADGVFLFFVGGREHVITVNSIDVEIDTAGAAVANAPVITGAADVTIDTGADFDLLDGVEAVDLEDGALTLDASNVTILGPNDETEFDSDVEGEWTITYTVADSGSTETVVTRKVTVSSRVWTDSGFIENGTFSQSPWYVWSGNWTGAGVEVNPDFTGGNAVLDIVNPGAQNWNIQLVQEGLNFVQDQEYKVTFDASTTVARDITFKVIAADNTEFAQTVAITDTATTYDFTFTFNVASQAGKISIELGGTHEDDPANPVNPIETAPASVVTIDNVMIEEYDGAAVVADSDMVVNGDFAKHNTIGWTSWSADGITSSFVEEWNEGVFRYDGVGTAGWNNQIKYENVPLVNGTYYRLTFTAKADEVRDFQVNCYDPTAQTNHFSEVLSVGTEFASYEYVFQYTTDNNCNLEFHLGNVSANVAGTTFYLDNVMLEREVDPAHVSWEDQELFQGTFDVSPWYVWSGNWTGAGVEVNPDFTGGNAVLDIVNPGAQNWNIQLVQEGLNFVQDQEYKVTFDASTTVARDITFKVIAADNTEFAHTVAITDTATTYDFTFTFNVASQAGKISIELGGTHEDDPANPVNPIETAPASVVTIDNVMIEEYDGAAVVADSDMVVNGDFAKHNTMDWAFWSADGITSSFVEEWNEGVFRYDGVGTEIWNNQVKVDGLMLEEGAKYKLTFSAKSDVAREFMALFYDGGQDFKPTTNFVFDADDTFQDFEFEFVYTSANAASLQFQLGKATETTPGATFYLDNVMLYKQVINEPTE